jgi:hypothetical protein
LAKSAAVRLLGLWVRIPTGLWMFVLYECFCCQVEVSSRGRSLVQRSPTECGVSLIVIGYNSSLKRVGRKTSEEERKKELRINYTGIRVIQKAAQFSH